MVEHQLLWLLFKKGKKERKKKSGKIKHSNYKITWNFFYCAGIFGKPNSSTNTPSWFVAMLSAPGSRSGASGAWKNKYSN